MMELPPRLRTLLRPNPIWPALVAAIALTGIGLIAIGTVPRLPGDHDFVADQARWFPVAAVAMLACMVPHPRQIGQLTYPVMIAVTGLLLIQVLPFMPRAIVPVLNGARHWIHVGGLSLQPSELAKIAFILALARYLRDRDSYRTLPGLLLPFGIMFVPVLLIFREPDLGTAILFPPVLFAVLIAAGAKLKHMLSLVGIGVAVIAVSIAAIYFLPEKMQLLERHQRLRIVALVSQMRGEDRFASDIGYQQNTAQTLVGSGGVLGLGPGRAATVIRFNYLPEAHNDMIFAIVADRWGWIGGMATLGLYGVLIFSLLWAAAVHKDPFARLVFVGFGALLLGQVAINVGMSLGVAPIIGITLPFVSYGGTSLVASFIVIGLALNLAAQPPAIINRPAFEFDRQGPAFS